MGASAGRVLLIPKGDWNANTTYTGLDWVRHNGASWVCKNTCTNIEPTLENADNWQMMARDGDGVTADTAMSDTSTNAVQNKVIKSYVDNSITGISDMTGATATQNGTHGFVPAPQAGDEKKVLLGDGTWSAIDDKFSFADHDTATSGTSFNDAEDGNMLVTDWTRNLLKPTLETVTQNGVTCTSNGDGSYTLNGTATSNATFILANADNTLTAFKGHSSLKLVGFPKKYASAGVLQVWRQSDNLIMRDRGDGVIITGSDIPYGNCNIAFVIYNGAVADGMIIKPMLTTDLSATYDDFVPYGGYEIQSCGKNLLSHTLKTATMNGVTFTNNGDGTYTLNGTANSDIWFDLTNIKNNLSIGHYKFIEGAYKEIAGKNIDTYLSLKSADNQSIGVMRHNNIENISSECKYYQLFCYVANGAIVNNVVIKPMLTTDLSATYDDFEPYTGETITVTNDTEAPAFGLKSHKGITNIISPGNVKCVYPTNESGKGVLDAMYNHELSKLKNAIFTYSTKAEYDTAVANNEIPDGATVIKDYDD